MLKGGSSMQNPNRPYWLVLTLTCCVGCASVPRPVATACPPPPPLPGFLAVEPSPENFQETIGTILRRLLSDAPTNANETPPR
jgi:hypothetical protein